MAAQKRVLVVEDEAPLLHALQVKLKHAGFDVSVASNGTDCVKLIESQEFDVVLLDIMMPIMNGFQVLETLRKSRKPPAVFVLSNLSQAEDEQRALALGARKYFIKSDISLSAIVDEVQRA